MIKELSTDEFIHYKYSKFNALIFFKDPSSDINKELYQRIRYIFCYHSEKKCCYFNWKDFKKCFGTNIFKNNLNVFILGNENISNIKNNPSYEEIDGLFCSIPLQILPKIEIQQKKETKNKSTQPKPRQRRTRKQVTYSRRMLLPRHCNESISGISPTKRAGYLKNKNIENQLHNSSKVIKKKCINSKKSSLSPMKRKNGLSYIKDLFKSVKIE